MEKKRTHTIEEIDELKDDKDSDKKEESKEKNYHFFDVERVDFF